MRASDMGPRAELQELCRAEDELGRMKGEPWIKGARREVISGQVEAEQEGGTG